MGVGSYQPLAKGRGVRREAELSEAFSPQVIWRKPEAKSRTEEHEQHQAYPDWTSLQNKTKSHNYPESGM